MNIFFGCFEKAKITWKERPCHTGGALAVVALAFHVRFSFSSRAVRVRAHIGAHRRAANKARALGTQLGFNSAVRLLLTTRGLTPSWYRLCFSVIKGIGSTCWNWRMLSFLLGWPSRGKQVLGLIGRLLVSSQLIPLFFTQLSARTAWKGEEVGCLPNQRAPCSKNLLSPPRLLLPSAWWTPSSEL